MSFISYAQNFEDVMLWRALQNVQSGFYIDVGAAWPDEHSVTKAFYDRGWSGINIEPNPKFHSKLSHQRKRDINLLLAAGKESANGTINIIENTGLSTLQNDIALHHQEHGWQTSRLLIEIKTLNDIWKTYLSSDQVVHFLKIDVEGFELNVIQGNNWEKNRPWIVLVEATLPLSQEESYIEWENVLLKHHYQLVYADGLNRFYIAKEYINLSKHFKYPPNVFDNYILNNFVNLEKELQLCRSHNQELKKHQEESIVYRHELHKLTQSLNEIESSRAWKFAKLLRKSQPKYWKKNIIQSITMSNIFIDKIKPQLKKYPWVWENIKRKFLFVNHSNEFTNFYYHNINILFSNGPLADQRGIGRVTRELMTQMSELTCSNNDSPQKDYIPTDKIYFYSSIHWCPETLPFPSVVMIHDVIPLVIPEAFSEAAVYEWTHRYKQIAQQASHIVTISQASAHDIESKLEISPQKITVIYNGITQLPVASNPFSIPTKKPYLTYLGSHDYHKNLDIVLKALALSDCPDIDLLLIGDNKEVMSKVIELSLEDRVYFMGRLSDEDTGYIIKNTVALVFPSLYEGFGLPPLEAALLGTPSICSDRPAMNELLKDAAFFADPYSAESWKEQIKSILTKQDNAFTIKNNSYEIASSLSWKKTTAKLLEVFEKLTIKTKS